MSNYAWRFTSGDWYCNKKYNQFNLKWPATPYVNRATIYPSIESAKFCKPCETAKLYKIIIKAEKVNE